MILAVGSLRVRLTIYQFFDKSYPEKKEQVNLTHVEKKTGHKHNSF